MLSWMANLPILKTVTSFTEKSPIISKRIIINKCKITTTDHRKHFYQGLVPRNSPIVIDMLKNIIKNTSIFHTVSNYTISMRTCSCFLIHCSEGAGYRPAQIKLMRRGYDFEFGESGFRR